MTRQRWSPLIIIKTIKELHAAEHPLNSNYAQQTQKRLYGAAVKYYGSWHVAIEAAGFNYAEVRKQDPKPVTIQRVVAEIEARVAAGKHIGGGAVSKEARGLYGRAMRLFPGEDSWRQALKAAGIDPNTLPDPNVIWTKDRVLATIRERYGNSLPLYGFYLDQHGLAGLVGAGERIFGSWGAAITAAGLTYSEIRAVRHDYWTPELVVEAIKKYAGGGNRLSLKTTQQDRADLFGAAIKCFGNWGQAVTAAGFNYQVHCRVRSTKFWLSQMSRRDYETVVSEERVRLVKTRKVRSRKGTR